jgi:hypothetical protein
MTHVYRIQYFVSGDRKPGEAISAAPDKANGVKEIVSRVFPNAPPEQVAEIIESLVATAKSDDDMAAVYHMPGAPYDGQSWITCEKLEVL